MGEGPGVDADPTEVSDAVAVAAAEPTEMAGVAEAETAASYAWALDDGQDDLGRRMTPRRITTVAIAASLVAIAGAGVVAFVHLRDRSTAVEQAATPAAVTTTSATPVAAPAPPAPPPVTVTTVIVQSTVPAPQAPPPVPQAARVMSTWTYEVSWGGSPALAVVEHADGQMRTRYIGNGGNPGTGTGWTGDLIGVDPIIDGTITWAGCRLYIDGRMAKADSATRGDGHDVSCLVRLTR